MAKPKAKLGKAHWRKRSLAREGEPTQRTKSGLEIPVPTRKEWEGAIEQTASKRSLAKPSKPAKAKRRTRRAAR